MVRAPSQAHRSGDTCPVRPPSPGCRSKMEFLLSCEKKMPKPVGIDHLSDGLQLGVSLAAQAQKLRAMAVVHGAELFDIIVDGGESAKSLQRPGIRRSSAARIENSAGAIFSTVLTRTRFPEIRS